MTHSASTPKILLVEDNLLVASALASVLEAAGFPVVVETDGNSAGRLLRRPDCDVGMLVCDLNLPGLSGRDLLELSVMGAPTRPVIIVSGAVEDTVVRELYALGAAEVLPKPVHPRDLIAAVQHLRK